MWQTSCPTGNCVVGSCKSLTLHDRRYFAPGSWSSQLHLLTQSHRSIITPILISIHATVLPRLVLVLVFSFLVQGLDGRGMQHTLQH